MILGFVIPVALSVVLISVGKGIDVYGANYWTGVIRWAGAYDSSHNMGHNMAFLLMVMGIYYVIGDESASAFRRAIVSRSAIVGMAVMAMAAIYCLWMSQVRTALVGVLVFLTVYLSYANKRILIGLTVLGAIIFLALYPVLKPILLPDVVQAEKSGQKLEEAIGSGRPDIWKNNIEHFAEMPFDRKLAGAGIGFNRLPGIMDSHNDFLDLVMQTGMVGAALFVALQVVIFGRIRALPAPQRQVFLAIFIAVTVMNFVSNSYVARFGLAQMYYLVLAYIELKHSESQTGNSLTQHS
jgi:O-antigen ligase